MDVSALFPLGSYIFNNFPLVINSSLILIGVFVLFALRNSILGISIAIGCAGICISIYGNLLIGCCLFLINLFLLCLYKPKEAVFDNKTSDDIWLICLTLTALIFGIILRTTDLDIITGHFEGELAPYMAAASSLKGSFLANKGINGPWAPLGILYYLPMLLCYELFGITLWSARFSSALVGIFTILILFVVTKKIFNLKVALISVAIFSLNYLHIGWSRTDVHPHGVTAWPALLVFLATALFLDKKVFSKWRALFLIFTMALSWHQYPSGQSAVAIPFFTTAILLVSGQIKFHRIKYILPTLSIGAILWYLGLPVSYYLADGTWDLLNPFTLTTTRTSWGNTSESIDIFGKIFFVLNQSSHYLLLFLESLVHKTTYIHHQDFLAFIPHMHPRTYAFFLIPFTLVGLVHTLKNCSNTQFATLISFLLAALAPGILSESPVPKRLSVTFLVLDIISAIGLVTIINLIQYHNRKFSYQLFKLIFSIFILFGICFHSFAFLSGKQYLKDTPAEVEYAQDISKRLKANTLIIADITKDYDLGKLIFLLLDSLYDPKNHPIFFSVPRSPGEALGYIDNPSFAIQDEKKYKFSWIYQWTKLRKVFEKLSGDDKFSTIIILLQYKKDQESREAFEVRLKVFENRCLSKPNYKYSTIIHEADKTFQNPLALITCEQN